LSDVFFSEDAESEEEQGCDAADEEKERPRVDKLSPDPNAS
jgi:hypothetical protein